MVTSNVFRSTRLFREGSRNMVLFSLQHGTMRSNMTDHTTIMASRNKLRSIQISKMRPKRRLWLKSLSLYFLFSFVWKNVHRFVFKCRTHNKHKIGFHNMIATKIFFIFRLLAIGFVIKHLACILKDSISYLRSSTSLLDKTSLASKSTFKHSNSFNFSKECSTSFLYFSTNLLD